MDVSDEEQATGFVKDAAGELGGLHILVNNAGLMLLGPVSDQTTDDWRRMVGVNLLGLLYCTHAALPLMARAGGGDIVNVSSVAGRRADAGAAVYNMTKFGVHAFSEALRQEALHVGVRVTVVAPGLVDTAMSTGWEAAYELWNTKSPMRRPAQPADIADMVWALIANPYVTGEVVIVDGGLNLT